MNVIICCCVLSVCCCYLFLTLLTVSACNKSLEVSWLFFFSFPRWVVFSCYLFLTR